MVHYIRRTPSHLRFVGQHIAAMFFRPLSSPWRSAAALPKLAATQVLILMLTEAACLLVATAAQFYPERPLLLPLGKDQSPLPLPHRQLRQVLPNRAGELPEARSQIAVLPPVQECFMCDEGAQCVPHEALCDGHGHCVDGWDESPQLCNQTFDCSASGRIECPPSENRMAPKQCIYSYQACNGKPDCGDGGDETVEFCSAFDCAANGRVKCSNDTLCMDKSMLCDGTNHCSDGSDETDELCSKPATCTDTGRVHCPGKRQCLSSESDLCDGLFQCADESDEGAEVCSQIDCSATGRVNCPVLVTSDGAGDPSNSSASPRCVQPIQMCDGQPNDCPGNADEHESVCKNHTCTRGMIKCGNVCRWGAYCDGEPQCPVDLSTGIADDESPDFCKDFACPPNTVKCGTVCLWGSYCDGEPQCSVDSETGIAEDEDPEMCKGFTCPPDTVKCGNICRWGFYCDGSPSCPEDENGVSEDENPEFCKSFACRENWTKCEDGVQCIWKGDECNNYTNCNDGSDERESLCRENYNCSATGRVPCPSGGSCMRDYCGVCQSKEYPACPDGSDQLESNCGLRNESQCIFDGCWYDPRTGQTVCVVLPGVGGPPGGWPGAAPPPYRVARGPPLLPTGSKSPPLAPGFPKQPPPRSSPVVVSRSPPPRKGGGSPPSKSPSPRSPPVARKSPPPLKARSPPPKGKSSPPPVVKKSPPKATSSPPPKAKRPPPPKAKSPPPPKRKIPPPSKVKSSPPPAAKSSPPPAAKTPPPKAKSPPLTKKR